MTKPKEEPPYGLCKKHRIALEVNLQIPFCARCEEEIRDARPKDGPKLC